MNENNAISFASMATMETENITNETRLTRLQAIVVEILNDLLRAPTEETDCSIDRAIGRLGGYCLRDRAYVFVNGEGFTTNTHEWCAPGIEAAIDQLQELPWELYGPIYHTLNAGETFHVPDVSALEEGSPTRVILESQEIRSILMVPMQWEGRFFGILGFDGVQNSHAFLPGEIYLLRSVADVICSVLTRRSSERARQAAQQALESEQAFLQSVLTTSAMGVLVLDGNGIITFANDAATDLLGIAQSKLHGMPHHALHATMVPLDESSQATDGTPATGGTATQAHIPSLNPGATPFAEILRHGQPVADARFALHRPAGPRYCAVHAAPVDSGHKQARVVYALVDVTEQVLAEAARAAALEEARSANMAKTRFLARMSHEMRTPLNGVLGIADVLRRLIDDPDQKRMLGVMHASGTLLLSIINDLLDMSKIEADQLAIEQIPFDLAEIADRIEAVHTLRAAEKQLSFGVTLSSRQRTRRMGDPHRLLQILHNVISNAVKFTSQGTIQVSIDCSQPDSIALEVVDTGIGMTPEEQQHVFEEFGQADTAIARKFGGTGLGMPIVKRLVELMAGDITFSSESGKGTRVSITLPLRALAETTNTVSAPALVNDGRLQGLRVLAADDNRTNRMILGAMMGQLGISAVLTADGPSALKAYENEDFDAVILDISMPEMDGITVLKKLRKREAMAAEQGSEPRRHLPILAFTANAMDHQVAAYLQAGFDDCLTKPLQLDRLRSALAALIEPADGPAASQAAPEAVSSGTDSLPAALRGFG